MIFVGIIDIQYKLGCLLLKVPPIKQPHSGLVQSITPGSGVVEYFVKNNVTMVLSSSNDIWKDRTVNNELQEVTRLT